MFVCRLKLNSYQQSAISETSKQTAKTLLYADPSRAIISLRSVRKSKICFMRNIMRKIMSASTLDRRGRI